jgi:hypothetical protein
VWAGTADVSQFNVNSIAIEVPIAMLSSTGKRSRRHYRDLGAWQVTFPDVAWPQAGAIAGTTILASLRAAFPRFRAVQ